LLVLAKRVEARMLTDEHHAVNTMIDRGAAFDQIEDYIDTLVLPGEQLSALWLLAWAEAADLPRAERWWRRKCSPLPASPDPGGLFGSDRGHEHSSAVLSPTPLCRSGTR
jgi:hypothetical protein